MRASALYTHGKLALLGLALATQSCKPDLDANTPSTGGIDFSKYVAVGNSLTAGYQSSGLSREGQDNSYPLILANAMKQAGATGAFNQPLFPENSKGSGYITLTGFAAGSPVLGFQPGDASQVTDSLNTAFAGKQPNYKEVDNPFSLNNLGIPGIRVDQITATTNPLNVAYGAVNSFGYNPYFERIVPDAAPLSYTQFVAKTRPTFFTCWLGNNDVLGYALAGGSSDPITSRATFETAYKEIVDTLTRFGAKGMLTNLPSVTSIPYFTTIPYNPVLLTADQATALNASPTYIGYNLKVDTINSGLPTADQIPKITFVAGLNPPVIAGETDGRYLRVGGQRQAIATDLILLPAQLALQAGAGTRSALSAGLVLTAAELALINQRTAEINTFIKDQATTRGLAFFDANAYLDKGKTGVSAFGVPISAAYISGGAFSLDGVHPTPRGYAFLANEMIGVINAKYGSKLPTVNPADYAAVQLPQ